jgi:hypothetical protein
VSQAKSGRRRSNISARPGVEEITEEENSVEGGELLYPGKPVRVDIPKEIETMVMSEDFTYQSINRMEYLAIPSAKVL